MRILHLLDSSVGWESRVAIGQLLDRLPTDDYPQRVATIDPATRNRICLNDVPVTLLPRRLGLPALAGAAIRSCCEREAIDLVHAWGIEAAVAARAAYPNGMPIAVTVFDPAIADRRVSMLRSVDATSGFAVLCAAERVRQRLVERGVPIDACVVIRPGVDFSIINAADRESIRTELGLPEGGMTVLTAELPGESTGHLAAIWSVLMRWYLDDHARVIVPGQSDDIAKLRRLARGSESPEIVIFTGSKYPFEMLLSVADYFVIASTGEVSITSIAWAMASSTPVIAPATYATAEILANDLNGILFKAPAGWRRLGATLCAQYDQTTNLPKIKETARGHAYETFSLRRTVQQLRQLYDNLSKGMAPATDIAPPSTIAVGDRMRHNE